MKLQNLWNNLKIYQRLWLMAGVSVGALLFGIILNSYNMNKAESTSSSGLNESTEITRAVDIAREAQVNFKRQVQEWKNSMLRGGKEKDFIKYWESFNWYEKTVQNNLRELKTYYQKFNHPLLDPDKVDKAINEQKKLGKKYRAALLPRVRGYSEDEYTAENAIEHKLAYKSRSAGDTRILSGVLRNKSTIFSIDTEVRGIDREPTQYIDSLVRDMMSAQSDLMAGIQQETEKTFFWGQIITFSGSAIATIFVFLLSFFTIRNINRPLERTIGIFHEISEENLENDIPTDRPDEIGEMWRALDTMQTRLHERTEALNKANIDLEESLSAVKAMKEEQDGDYFLTYLLTAPLGSVHVQSQNVHVDSYVEQKKKFKFRKWQKEIGGDINIARRLPLRNRNFIVFLNGDAMGKSIQGAGGALVLGSVFQSIIQRTLLSKDVQQQFPEKWLKHSFIELHKVFESFDGSMLMSAVIGLVDEEKGILYFINAEHPDIILYRDGKASFLKDEHFYRKLGTQGLEGGEIFIKKFQMQPEDIIIAGSDGRDDLELGRADDGSRIINEDQNLFLEIVEKGRGDILSIKKLLLEKGRLTDDISLLRLAYKEAPFEINPVDNKVRKLLNSVKINGREGRLDEVLTDLEEAVTLSPRNPEVLKTLVQLHLKRKNFKAAYRYARDYVDYHPEDDDFIYIAAYTAKMSTELDDAVNYAESLRLRNKSHLKNLINLADVHYLRRNYRRSHKVAKEALELHPQHENLKKIMKNAETQIENTETEEV